MRFWARADDDVAGPRAMPAVSTLLEILGKHGVEPNSRKSNYNVSTLLEILGLVCLVVVGF